MNTISHNPTDHCRLNITALRTTWNEYLWLVHVCYYRRWRLSGSFQKDCGHATWTRWCCRRFIGLCVYFLDVSGRDFYQRRSAQSGLVTRLWNFLCFSPLRPVTVLLWGGESVEVWLLWLPLCVTASVGFQSVGSGGTSAVGPVLHSCRQLAPSPASWRHVRLGNI